MSGRILRFPDAHQTVDRLLPWYVNGTLEGEELGLVERHLAECGRCRHEMDALRVFQAAYAGAEMAPAAERSMGELLCRLHEPRPRWWTGWRRRWAGLWPFPAAGYQARRWAPWAAAVELAVILVLVGMLLAGRESPTPYRTLGAPEAPLQAMGRLVVVFEPQLTEAELRRIVLNSGARIVDGPTVEDAYVLEVPVRRQAAALQALRGQHGVALAEGLGPGTAP